MKELRFWQGDWWRQKERIRWAATIGLALLLVAGGVYIDRAQARQEAAEQAALAAQAAQEQQALAEEREEALAQAQEAAVQAAREAAAQAAALQERMPLYRQRDKLKEEAERLAFIMRSASCLSACAVS